MRGIIVKLTKKILCCLLSTLIFTGCTSPLDKFKKSQDNSTYEEDDNPERIMPEIDDSDENSDLTEISTAVVLETLITTETSEITGGGGYLDKHTPIYVTVSESTFLYENKSIKYDDLIKIIEDKNKEDIVVVIQDDNATLKDYQKLIKYLEENEILIDER